MNSCMHTMEVHSHLVGPQGVGDSVTQLRSRTIIDTTNASQLNN